MGLCTTQVVFIAVSSPLARTTFGPFAIGPKDWIGLGRLACARARLHVCAWIQLNRKGVQTDVQCTLNYIHNYVMIVL